MARHVAGHWGFAGVGWTARIPFGRRTKGCEIRMAKILTGDVMGVKEG